MDRKCFLVHLSNLRFTLLKAILTYALPEDQGHRKKVQFRGNNTRFPSSHPNEQEHPHTIVAQAWGKTPPNTGRKRGSRPPLLRSVPSPSHSAHMRKIFQNATTSLHSAGRILGSSSIPRVLASEGVDIQIQDNDTYEISEKRSEDNHFTFTDQLPSPLLLHPVVSPNGTRWTAVPMPDEPISSGFHSPYFPHQTSSPSFANSQYLSRSKPKRVPLPPYHTGSSPLDLAETKLAQRFQDTSISNVQSWLDGLCDEPSSGIHECDDSPSMNRVKREESLVPSQHHTSLGSNTENKRHSSSTFIVRVLNQPPSPAGKDSDSLLPIDSSPTAIPRPNRSKYNAPSTPILVRKPHKCYTSPRSQGRGHISLTLPRGHFMLPPRRKRTRASSSSLPQQSPPAYGITQTFEVAEDGISDILGKRSLPTSYQEQVTLTGLRDLSPHVTPFRKGKGPKRSRCPSYYDEDFLQEARLEREKKVSSTSSEMSKDSCKVPLEETQDVQFTEEPIDPNRD